MACELSCSQALAEARRGVACCPAAPPPPCDTDACIDEPVGKGKDGEGVLFTLYCVGRIDVEDMPGLGEEGKDIDEVGPLEPLFIPMPPPKGGLPPPLAIDEGRGG